MTAADFESKVFCHKHLLFRFAKSILTEAEDAEDVVQAVMIKFWQMRERLSAVEKMDAFMLRSVKNECLNKIKQVQMHTGHERTFAKEIPISVHAQQKEAVTLVKKFIQQLPDKQRQVMHLKDIEGYETSEIAGILEMEETAVRVNLARARQKTREYLTKIAYYEQRQVR